MSSRSKKSSGTRPPEPAAGDENARPPEPESGAERDRSAKHAAGAVSARPLEPEPGIGGERIVPMRLQKFLARAGAASRRGSENLMTAGRVTVNGAVVTELGSKVDPRIDEVAVDGIVVRLSDEPVTLALNKPAGVVTTMSDPQGRPCVAGLVPTDRYPGLYPIGRLDRDTTGLLLFSTDGELGHALLHPKKHVEKRYVALVEGELDKRAIERLRAGIELDDGMTLPAEVDVLSPDEAKRAFAQADDPPSAAREPSKEYARELSRRAARRSVVSVRICEGRKRQVRRMFEAVGHPVVHLHRTDFGPIALGEMAPGTWREIEGEELAALYSALRR